MRALGKPLASMRHRRWIIGSLCASLLAAALVLADTLVWATPEESAWVGGPRTRPMIMIPFPR